ncbi:MAG: 30S ribosomal protein S16 [Candidatus Peribacteraceae bacterium]|nr:30S ribosomal protein S16 [Candidatus Peribacteraceae bacterium]
MLVIRLQRTGRSKVPTYRLVVAEKARPVKSKFLEILGHYNAAQEPALLTMKNDRVQYWIGRGAIPSDTAARQMKRAGMDNMEKYFVRYAKRTSKKAPAEAPAASAAAPQAPVSEPAPPAPEAA